MKRQQVMDAIRALGYDPHRVSGVRMTVRPYVVEVDTVEWDEDKDGPAFVRTGPDDGHFATYTDTHQIED